MSVITKEHNRLAALDSYDILDTAQEEDYDAITRIASQICGMPISTISLVDDHRQWFKSTVGLQNRQTPREHSFCAHAIQVPGQLMEIPDARLDSRFATNPLTTGEPYVIFYAGVPLVDEQGYALGTLCVIDNQPNQLTADQKNLLQLLARQVITLLTLRRNKAKLETAYTKLSTTNKKLYTANKQWQESNRVLKAVVDNCPAGLILWQAVRQNEQIVDFQYVLTNPFNAHKIGWGVDQLIGNTLKNVLPANISDDIMYRLTTAVETQQQQHYQHEYEFYQTKMWGNFWLDPMGDQVLVTYQDISHLKATENQLRAYSENLEARVAERTAELQQKNQELHTFFEVALDMHSIATTDGTILKVNRAWQHTLGFTDTELTNLNYYALMHPDEQKATHQLMEEAILRQKGVKSTNHFRTKNGDYRLLEWSLAIVDNLLFASAHDITYRHENEQQLKTLNQRLQLATQAANQGIWEYDQDQDTLICDERMCAIHGLPNTGQPIRLQDYLQLVHPDDLPHFNNERSRQPFGTTHTTERRIIRPDGTLRYTELYRIRFKGKNPHSINSVGVAIDITERKQAELALRQSEHQYRSLVDNLQEVVFQTNSQRELIFLSPYWPTLTGYSIEESLGTPSTKYYATPDDQIQTQAAFDELMSQRSPAVRLEITFRHKNGEQRWAEMFCQPVIDECGRPNGLTGTITDITERKQAESALRESEQRYRSLIENLHEVVFQTNLRGELTFLSPYWTHMTGYTIEESLGKSSSEYYKILPNHETGETLVAQPKEYVRLEATYTHKNGEQRWAEIFYQPLLNGKNQTVGYTGTLIDITQRKKALDAFLRSEQRFGDIAENVSEIFWIHAAKPFSLLYINPAYERLTGQSPESMYENPAAFLTIVLPDDLPSAQQDLQRYMAGEELNVEYQVKTADTTLRWLNIRTFVKRSKSGDILNYIGLASDITSQKERERVLQQALKKEQELNQLKSQFVATASHEFRTPLATIQSSVDLIKMYVERSAIPPESPIKRHLNVIEKEVINFSVLLSDVLTLGKIEAGKVPFNPKPTDFVPLIDSLLNTHFSNRADGRQVTVSIEGIPRPIQADPQLFSHLIINLLSNAFKFSTSNPTLQLTFEASQLLLIIADEGIGIPADEQPHLFEPFFRARNASTIQGTGLGLIITREFVVRHGGQLSVQSQENQGTTFTITLPTPA